MGNDHHTPGAVGRCLDQLQQLVGRREVEIVAKSHLNVPVVFC